MHMTQRKPVSVGEMISEEFLVPLKLSRAQLAEAMGVEMEVVNALCENQCAVDAETALILAKVFGNTAEFWLNTQQRNVLWTVLNNTKCVEHLRQAKPLVAVAA